MIVYHGSVMEINKPDIMHSIRNLDFGKGFYVTTNIEQAKRWALRKADLLDDGQAVVSEYILSEEQEGFEILDLFDDMDRWIDFVCECRNGSDVYKKYDIIKGKVADDKVYRVVDMYRNGIWEKDRAIEEMKVYETYDQIAFITQRAIDGLLSFKGSSEVADG